MLTVKTLNRLAISITVGICLTAGTAAAHDKAMQQPVSEKPMIRGMVERSTVDRIIAVWANRPRLGAVEMMTKYGPPQEATSERLVWHNVGPYERITVMNLETPHDFPMPHVDFMEHTIAYNVPQDKVGDLIAFDASSTINRTVGELSARCDLEGHNILTLNLDNDIVNGKKTVAQARQSFGENVQQDVMGKHPAYVEALQFKPDSGMAAAFSDKPVVPGSPLRAAEASSKASGDAEILASVVAVDLNEIGAAAQAETKKLSQPVMDYARMLHRDHGMNLGQTLKLGQQISLTPVITSKVEDLQNKGAGELAGLVPLDGDRFERAYVDAMVKGHTEVLGMLDGDLKTASNAALKTHLTATRAAVADHLAKAQALQRKH